jgi:hypothetical protein
MVGYNVQAAVDTTNHLIVAHEVINIGTDRSQLANMALCDRSGRSAWPEVASGLTPDPIQKKYVHTVVSAWIAPGCVQSLGAEKCFHTAWNVTRPSVSFVWSIFHPSSWTARIANFTIWTMDPLKVSVSRL